MTPKLSIETQNILGSDIAMIFDCLININDPKEKQIEAINLTRKWGDETIKNHKNNKQALFGIIQGGLHKDLRELSAKYMIDQEYDGYAIGGLAIGESREERKEIVSYTIDILPENKPRYVMGLGDTHGLIDLIEEGVDLFDCVWPSRLARHGKLIDGNEYINIKNSRYKNDIDPINKDCPCYTCTNYSKAFLRHLILNEPTSSWLYLTVHNLIQTEIILDEARESILQSNFKSFKENVKMNEFITLLPLISVFIIFTILYIPQRRRNKKHKQFISELNIGDNVVTDSGIYGRITSIKDNNYSSSKKVKLKLVNNIQPLS